MRLLGVTQGSSIHVFLRLAEILENAPDEAVETAIFASDALAYKNACDREAKLRDGSIPVLKEWEITSIGKRTQPDWEQLARWEDKLGDPVLWNILLADRRLFFGRSCKFRQDYQPRFSYEQMGGILQTAITAVDHFLERTQPTVAICFGTATLGDYLTYRFCKTRGIPFLLLKSTKIANFVSLNDDAIELSDHVKKLMLSESGGLQETSLSLAKRHIETIRNKGVKYEGAIKSSVRFRPIIGMLSLLRGTARDIRSRLDTEINADNHVESSVQHAWHTHFQQPVVGAMIRRRFNGNWVNRDDLKEQPPFAFFPLHFEPEVAIQVFGRPFQNQIELIRHLALNLPTGMLLLVKEHPRSIGFRPHAYYQKLLEIPNVRLVTPELPTHLLIQYAKLVAVISGSTGLEAAICGRPVITFGLPTYNCLPTSMILHASNPHKLGDELRKLLKHYSYNEDALIRFLAAHVEGAVPIDLYSVLLGKPGRHNEGREHLSIEQRRQEDYSRLADYCRKRISDVIQVTG